MKNLSIILVGAMVIGLFGCDVASESEVDTTLVSQKGELLSSMNTEGVSKSYSQDQLNALRSPDIFARKSTGMNMVRGHMDWYPNNSNFTWKESVNATGDATTGSGQVEIKSNFWGDVHGTVLCVSTMGNEAIVGIYITNNKEYGHPVYEKGRVVWFRLIDNGEGDMDPADQHYNTVHYLLNLFETLEEAQAAIASVPCDALFEAGWGFAKDIEEGNFQVK